VKRRSPLRRKTPLRASARRRTSRPSSYRRRERDLPYMAWIRRQPCVVRTLPPDPNRLTPCSGRIEADHLGGRALGRKADDRTCISLCSQHHRERSDHAGAWRDLDQAAARAWREKALGLVERWAVRDFALYFGGAA
jgi:hypothetical protein